MNDWWKAPVLQGPENDYGEYDYMIEEIPQNYAKWELDKRYKWKCDDCGKDRHLRFVAKEYFRTMDGYDYFSYSTCWMCAIKNWIAGTRFQVIYNTNRNIKRIKFTLNLYKASNRQDSLKDCWKLARKFVN